MFNNKYLKNLITPTISLLLISCASQSSSNTYSKNHKSTQKSSLPKVPAKVLPGGSGDNWRYLATSDDNQIAIEINDSSISKNSSINKFQDRKTIINPAKFNYQNFTPNYKYSLSWWQLNCDQKQIIINSTSIYDEFGKLIKNYSFNSNNVWSNISSDSIAEQQYNYICNGTKRNLGY